MTATTTPPKPRVAPTLTPRLLTAMAGVAGAVSALATLAVAEVVSLLMGGGGNPILAVGSLIIDLVPAGFKTLVINLFDTADKLVLFIALGLTVLVFAVIAGVLQLRRPPWGAAVLSIVALVALVASATRADATVVDVIPTVLGAITGVLVLRALTARLILWRDARPPRPRPSRPPAEGGPAVAPTQPSLRGTPVQYERRSFIRFAVVTAVASAVAGSVARAMSAAATAVNEARASLGLPAAAVPTAPVTAADTLNVTGISPFITPNDEFYRIDTALQVPSVDPTTWSLRISGMVEEEIEISYDELAALPLEEHIVTLACVSNEVGGDLIGNALWLGYPIRELLARARPTAGADMVLSTSIDGFTASTPLDVLQEADRAALLAIGMNGEPLPLEHGFPVRMVVPGLFGYVSATKWVTELKVTTFAADMGYWTSRGWTARGPVKLSSRIDVPTNGFSAPAGATTIAGVAWSQHTGVSAVEVRIDDGEWQRASLAPVVTVDAWLQWSLVWNATSGSHRITVRAIDADGLVQTADEAPPAPDGSTGLHEITVQVN